MLMAFCPPLGMAGKVFASPVDQLAAMDVALVLLVVPYPVLKHRDLVGSPSGTLCIFLIQPLPEKGFCWKAVK
jgi:hypothetical protein